MATQKRGLKTVTPQARFMPGVVLGMERRAGPLLARARELRARHRFQEAMECYTAALEACASHRVTSAQLAEIHRGLIECLCERGEYTLAREEIDRVQKALAPEVEVLNLEVARVHRLAALVHFQLGSYHAARQECHRALDIFEKMGDEKELAILQRYLGQIAAHTGALEEARHHYEESIDICTRLGDEAGVAATANRLAQVFFITADWDEAIHSLSQSLQIGQSTNDSRIVATSLGNMGTVHFLCGRWQEARECMVESLRLFEEIGDSLAIVRKRIVLGNLAQAQRDWAEAARLYLEAHQISKEKGYTRELALSLEFLGELAYERADYAEAAESYKQALALAEGMAPGGDLVHEIYRRMGELRVAVGDPVGAVECCQRALEVALRLGDRYEEGVLYRVFGEAFEAVGDMDKARNYFAQGVDSLSSIHEMYERGKTLLELGRFLREHFTENPCDRLEAQRHLARSREIFRELGAESYLAQAELELGRLEGVVLTRG